MSPSDFFYEHIYIRFFKKAWPKWVGGVILALLNIALFLYLMPFSGIYPAMAEWGVWSYRIAGINAEHPWGIAGPLHLSIISVLTFGFLLGALIGALFSKKFKIRKAGVDVYVRNSFGGAFMGIGSLLVGSCIIGGFYSSIMALSLSGFYMMLGLIIGAYIGKKVKPWIERKRPRDVMPEGITEKNYMPNLPKIGIFITVIVLAVVMLYFFNGKDQLGVLALFGLAFGLVFERSGFGFSSAFRDFFTTKNKESLRAVIISIAVGVIGFTTIKASALQPAQMLVLPAGWSTIAGGLIFGFGMVIADG